jgi:hypothetical protein
MSALSFEQKKEIFVKHLSGAKQVSLASQYNISQPTVHAVLKEFRRFAGQEFNIPFSTASLVPAHLGCSQNYQNPYATHFSPNLMQPRMLYAAKDLMQPRMLKREDGLQQALSRASP